ncbi:hypothetical protein PRIPAC_80263 [Pristionchus pacificus]|uniref:Uncharacterized protein n=1 Tax=Pristionchus pacificus TaxID=54126 RepID=A0A2A6C2U2_PRIPA|nr:hypothetical protein PRIPAC_80263 [Pristionchus pacificus]|eukprot:PDM72485.1 hypothetical protein PRIPAC_38919 [Pristionchus pacificus]
MSEFQCESTDSDFGDIRKDGSPTYSGEIPSNSGSVLRDVSTLSCDELSSSNNHFATNCQCNSPNGTSFIELYSNEAQLPLIEVPKFYGDITKWSEFFELFQLLVDNTQLSKIQNPDNYEFGFLLETKLPRENIQEIYSSSDMKPEHVSAKIILLKRQEIVKRIVLVDAIVRKKSFDEINPISIQKESKYKVAQFHVNHVASRSNPSCDLCDKKNHTAKHCKKYLHVCDKYNRVLEKKLCVRCFGKHNAEDCSSAKSCSKCGKDHHTIFCFILSDSISPWTLSI